MALIPAMAAAAGLALGSGISYLIFGESKDKLEEKLENTGLINNNYQVKEEISTDSFIKMAGMMIIIILLISIFTMQVVGHCCNRRDNLQKKKLEDRMKDIERIGETN